jgi:opacity protein-like surface antigen
MIERKKPFEIIGKKSTVAGAAAAVLLCAPTAMAQDVTADSEAVAPWYEAFTLSMAEAPTPELDEATTFDLELGEHWGVTLGYQDRSDSRLNDDLSAGPS